MSQQQLFIRLRGAIFAESGFCLHAGEIAPRLRKDTAAFFAICDRDGQRTRLEKILGCEGDDPDGAIAFPLTPYADPERGRELIAIMCKNLRGARAGDKSARQALGLAWRSLLITACGLSEAPPDRRMALLGNFFGAERLTQMLKVRLAESLNAQPERTLPAALRMVAEAFA